MILPDFLVGAGGGGGAAGGSGAGAGDAGGAWETHHVVITVVFFVGHFFGGIRGGMGWGHEAVTVVKRGLSDADPFFAMATRVAAHINVGQSHDTFGGPVVPVFSLRTVVVLYCTPSRHLADLLDSKEE